jgi:hypothetical protein
MHRSAFSQTSADKPSKPKQDQRMKTEKPDVGVVTFAPWRLHILAN